jgi:GT2 family glycosyltransferase
MDCESPRPGDSCRGVVLVRGWALTSASIEQIEIFLDGQKLGEATYSHHRSDLQCGCSSDPEGGRCGFNFAWDSAGVTEGLHVLTVSAQGKTGSPMVISIPVVVDPILAESEFDRWIAASEPSPERLKEMAREAGRFAHRPLLSIIVSVSCVPLKPLRAAIESVRNQLYTNWELCLADDGSHMPELAQLLQDYAAHDPRIKYAEPSEKRDISKASNAALALAAGEFVGFLDQDDELAPDALYWVVKLLQERLDADVIYSDEDRLDLNGKRSEPFFKPDWSPDLLLSFNYIRHFLVVRRQLLTELGGFRSACNGSQDYDLLLRLMAHTSKVLHLPRILYHCRAMRDSAVAAERKAHEVHAARRALEEYLLSNQVGARLEPGCEPGKWLVRYEVRGNPKVAVIMLTGGRMELLRPCLESFFTTTDYGNCEILLVDNSKGSDVEQYAAGLAQETRKLQLIDCRNKKFNYSALNNVAARRTGAPLLLLLNDDMTVVNEDWLTAMVEHAQRPKVGAVGAKLLYPSGRIQHAGAVMGIYGGTSHAFKHLPGNSRHYFCLAQVVRNCSHVTAACLMTKRSLYLEFGGLDEKHFKVAFQDVDYCLRLHKAGYFIVYTPAAVLVHHESATKNEKMPNLWEVRHLKKKWAEIIAHDPFYNPNLTRQSEDYRLRLE